MFAAVFDASGRYCVTAGADRTLRLWNATTGRLVHSYAAHSRQVLSAACSADGARLLSGSGDKAAIVWDVAAGTVARKLGGARGHTARVNAVCFGAVDELLVTGSYDRRVLVWDARAGGGPVQSIAHAADSVSDVAAVDERIVAGSVDGKLRIYDARKGVCAVDEIGAPVGSVAVSRDGNCVLAACLGAPMVLLDLAEGAALAMYEGHAAEAFDVGCAVMADDAWVVAGCERGRACVWDIVKGGEPAVRLGEGREGRAVVGAVAAHPKANMVLTGDHEGTVELWKVET